MNLVVVERDREVPEALDAFLDREMAEFDALVFRHGNLLYALLCSTARY